ncbi:MAG: flagellin, partial [Verrucomicrobiae bacterium]|nr:flagellin [Verrucomicrobiae bacterium]
MGLRVNTNIASLSAQRNLSTVSARLEGNYGRLASGLRIASAADDAAGL